MNLVIRPTTHAEDLRRATGFLARLAADKAWEVEVKPWVRRRSDAQNRYLWGIVYPAILQTLPGWDAEDVHDYFLGEHFGWETLEGFDKRRLRPIRRSSKLDKLEFADFVAFIQRKMAEQGVYIPDPNEGVL